VQSSFQTQGTRWFLIFAGAVLGVSAALLWSAQGSIMMSYPLEKDKGKAFGIFWAIFQFGSFIGSIIALAINIHSGKLSAVSTSTYLVRFLLASQSPLCVLITQPGVYHYHVYGYRVDGVHSASQRDRTRGWHIGKGRGVLVCAARTT
jgi:MFS family permease